MIVLIFLLAPIHGLLVFANYWLECSRLPRFAQILNCLVLFFWSIKIEVYIEWYTWYSIVQGLREKYILGVRKMIIVIVFRQKLGEDKKKKM